MLRSKPNGYLGAPFHGTQVVGSIVDLDITAVNSGAGFTFSDPSWSSSTQQFNLDGPIYFVITGATNVTGTFANDSQGVADQNLPGYSTITDAAGQEFAVTYDASLATDSFTGGHDVAVMEVPESTALSMLAVTVGLGLGLPRFRRRRP